ncbi:MAG: DMT family transporter [Pseudomonadota bacterium]
MKEHSVDQNALQAIGWMLWAVFLLSTMDVAIKQLVAHYPSLQVAVLRCLISAPLFAVWMLVQNRQLFRTRRLRAHTARALLGLLMLWAIGEAFRELPLADAYAIFFAAPLIMTLLSGPVMGEPAGPLRIGACAVGFLGVLVVLRPGADALLSYGSVAALLAVACYAVVALMVRALGREEHSLTIAFWFTFLCGTAGALFMPGTWQPLVLEHWPWLAILGVTGTLGQVALIAAFRRASAGVIAPLDYTAMLWAVLYGWWFWGELPESRTWVGAGIIIASGLFILHRERGAARQAQRSAARKRQISVSADTDGSAESSER